MGKPKEPEAEMGLFLNWTEPKGTKDPEPEAGIGLFSNHTEKGEMGLPDAGLGIFDHWDDWFEY